MTMAPTQNTRVVDKAKPASPRTNITSPPASHRLKCCWEIFLPMRYCRLITVRALVATMLLIIR